MNPNFKPQEACQGKTKFKTRAEASQTAVSAMAKHSTEKRMNAYKCQFCDFYHFGHSGNTRKKVVAPKETKPDPGKADYSQQLKTGHCLIRTGPFKR